MANSACLSVCVYVLLCYQPLSGALFLTSEDFVVLGSGIMDDAEFDLPAAVLRRVRMCASVQKYTRTYVHLCTYMVLVVMPKLSANV